MRTFLHLLTAFLVGGALCAIAQILIDKTSITIAKLMVIFVISGVLLNAVGAYKYIIEFAGIGATLPIIGFGDVLATGVRKAIGERGVLGIITGGLSATAAGIALSVFLSVIAGFCVKPKIKD